MVQAPVGWQCTQCTSEGAKRSRHVPAFTHTSRGRTGVVGATNPTPIVIAIIAINVVVFFFEDFGTNNSVIDRFGLWPDGVHFLHQYYRAFTAMWLHASFEHIFFNMITLLIVGPALEVLLGKVRFVALYLLAGLGGSVGSYILGPHNEVGIGASGAIMGVLGAYLVVGLRRRLPVAPVAILLVINFAPGLHRQHRLAGPSRWPRHRMRPGLAVRVRGRLAGPEHGPGAHGGGERGSAGHLGPAHHVDSPGSFQSQLTPRPGLPACGDRSGARSGCPKWLTVRQKSPYCLMSERDRRTI